MDSLLIGLRRITDSNYKAIRCKDIRCSSRSQSSKVTSAIKQFRRRASKILNSKGRDTLISDYCLDPESAGRTNTICTSDLIIHPHFSHTLEDDIRTVEYEKAASKSLPSVFSPSSIPPSLMWGGRVSIDAVGGSCSTRHNNDAVGKNYPKPLMLNSSFSSASPFLFKSTDRVLHQESADLINRHDHHHHHPLSSLPFSLLLFSTLSKPLCSSLSPSVSSPSCSLSPPRNHSSPQFSVSISNSFPSCVVSSRHFSLSLTVNAPTPNGAFAESLTATPSTTSNSSVDDDSTSSSNGQTNGNNNSQNPSTPTNHQLRLVLITSCIPFIGFGFVDNFCMILFGDYLDTTLCVRLGFSTLAAAAWGNLMSDVLGIKLGESIELLASKVTKLQPNLSNSQMTMRKTRRFYYTGCVIGMSIGCVLGMAPLLVLDTEEAERRKRKKAQDALFGQLSEELAQCLDAESVALYIVEKVPACRLEATAEAENLHHEQPRRFFSFSFAQTCTKKCICEKPDCQMIPSGFMSKDPNTGKTMRVDLNSGVPGLVFSTKKVVQFRPDATPSSESPPPTAFSPAFSSETSPSPQTAAASESLPSPLLSWVPFSPELGRVEVADVRKTDVIDGNEVKSSTQLPAAAPAAIGVPIFGVDADVIGVIEIGNPKDKPWFTRQDKELLLSISSHVAVEIQGKQHITHILSMCRNQVTAKRLMLSSAEFLPSLPARQP